MSVAPMPPTVGLGSLFDELRGRIRRYVLIEGVAVVGAGLRALEAGASDDDL